MNHITKEKSVDIAREHLWRYKPSGHPKQSDAYLFNDECMQALCNAAIEWYIDKSITELTLTPQEVNELVTQQAATQATPTVELPFIPWSKEAEMRESWAQAEKELTEKQIYWLAESHGIRIQKGLLGFCRDMMSTTHIGNVDSVCTSQERVQKSEKSEQVPLTDEQCDKVLQRIDEWATGYGAQEYGLPLFWMPNRARDVLREALGEKA